MLIIISSSISSSLLYYLSLMTLRPLLPVVIASVIVLLQTANISLRHAGRSATMFLHEWSTPHPSTCLQGVSKSQERLGRPILLETSANSPYRRAFVSLSLMSMISMFAAVARSRTPSFKKA
jgi:hypothetical protein